MKNRVRLGLLTRATRCGGQETSTRLACPVAEFARIRAIRGPVAGPPEVLATSATSETRVSPHWHAKHVRRPPSTQERFLFQNRRMGPRMGTDGIGSSQSCSTCVARAQFGAHLLAAVPAARRTADRCPAQGNVLCGRARGKRSAVRFAAGTTTDGCPRSDKANDRRRRQTGRSAHGPRDPRANSLCPCLSVAQQHPQNEFEGGTQADRGSKLLGDPSTARAAPHSHPRPSA